MGEHAFPGVTGASIRTIVVGVDGSAGAAHALSWAVREGRLHNATVTAVMAWGLLDQHHTIVAERFDPSYGDDDALDALRTFIADAVGGQAATVQARAVCDLPARALLDAAASADLLLVVGARGLGGFRGLLFGSVSQHCLHHTTTPLAIIRDHGGPAPGQADHVVVGIDGSDTAQRALRWALDEARARDATLTVVHAWHVPPPGYYPHATGMVDPAISEGRSARLLDDALAAEDTSGLTAPIERRSVCGGATPALLAAASDAQMLVLGSRGLGGVKGLLLGSVTLQAAHHAQCPLVVIPPTPWEGQR